MTISTEVRKAGPFIGNDSASVFPFAFKVFKAADLIVVRRQDNIGEEATLVLDSDYHVTLNSNQDTTPGGVVTLVAGALASGFTLVVSSELPYLQPTDLTNQGGFYPKVITNALDRLTIFCQQLAEITGRTLKLPITAPTNISAEIPLPNPSELIAWDETGTRLTTVSPQSLVTSIAYGSATADLFAGDGVTTTFPLSTNPASVNNLDVSVGGFSQRPGQGGIGDYSWNGGASITFAEPPPAPTVPGDKNVLVRYMQAIPVSDSEALHAQTREALRRSYAEAGYNLADGSFETGGTLASTSDVLLLESAGTAYAWTGVYPVGGYVVAPGIDPTVVPGFALRTGVLLRSELADTDGASLVGGATYAQIRAYSGSATKIHCLGRANVFDGASGDFLLDPSDTTSADNDGTVLIDASGGRWKRQISGDISVRWWLDGTGPSHDCGPGFQKAINSYPRSRIQVPLDELGYYFDTQVVEPNSASFELVGTEGIQSSLQQVMYARTSGAVFHSPAGQTTFTRYRGFRFISNKASYPAARAIHIAGDWVHGEMKSVVVQNFNLNPLLVSGAANVCNYQHIMGMFNNSWALRVEQGAGNTFTRITGDNNDGPVLYAYGGSNTFTNLYSEDCCKRNVTHSENNPEFLFGGDTPVVNGIILNSYAGNVTPPVLLAACRNMTLIGGANKSTTAPSYPYDIELGATDSSLTMINSSGLRTGNSDENVVIIDAGYTTTRPSIKVGPYQRDIYLLCPVAQVCFNGTGTPTIRQGAGISSVTRAGVGEYDINFAEPIPFANGIIVTGMADNNGGALNITVCEVLGARTTTKVRVRVQRTDGANIDTQFISVVVHGITG